MWLYLALMKSSSLWCIPISWILNQVVWQGIKKSLWILRFWKYQISFANHENSIPFIMLVDSYLVLYLFNRLVFSSLKLSGVFCNPLVAFLQLLWSFFEQVVNRIEFCQTSQRAKIVLNKTQWTEMPNLIWQVFLAW